jgi:hypothetical protein
MFTLYLGLPRQHLAMEQLLHRFILLNTLSLGVSNRHGIDHLVLTDPGPESSDLLADPAGAYWDLVHILYPEAVEFTGLTTARDLVAGWSAVEKELQARFASAHMSTLRTTLAPGT